MIAESLFRIYASLITARSNQRGASAVEYGLIVGLIAIILIGVLTIMGEELDGVFGSASDALTEVGTASE